MIFLVNDANILIDLLKIDLLDTFFKLEFDFQMEQIILTIEPLAKRPDTDSVISTQPCHFER